MFLINIISAGVLGPLLHKLHKQVKEMRLFHKGLSICTAIVLCYVFAMPTWATPLYLRENTFSPEYGNLPENAQVQAGLLDVFLADASAAIKAGQHYAAPAQIAAGQHLIFVTAARHLFSAGVKNGKQMLFESVFGHKNAAASDLAGKWNVARIAGRAVIGAKPLYAEFTSQAGVSGYSGCNRYGGTFKSRRNEIRFSQMIATKMACSGPLMQQEHARYKVFSKVRTYKFNKREIKFFDAEGSIILIFMRKIR